MTNPRNRQVLPVIHHLDATTTLEQADLAFRAGADGVFLISHNGQNGALFTPARVLVARYPDKQIGINLLGVPALDAFLAAEEAGLNMVWADQPGVSSAGLSDTGQRIAHAIAMRPERPTFFGSVAFKYQPHEPHPGYAAQLAANVGMLPTTSGAGTGEAPEVDKAKLMSEALNGGPLAVASGMTPENVTQFLPYFTHYLVATGVSTDMHHFDEGRLSQFIRIVKHYGSAA